VIRLLSQELCNKSHCLWTLIHKFRCSCSSPVSTCHASSYWVGLLQLQSATARLHNHLLADNTPLQWYTCYRTHQMLQTCSWQQRLSQRRFSAAVPSVRQTSRSALLPAAPFTGLHLPPAVASNQPLTAAACGLLSRTRGLARLHATAEDKPTSASILNLSQPTHWCT
jgi:hypothetical protein